IKLVCGQTITPVPWPIQSSPTASASRPMIRSDLRMNIPPSLPGSRSARKLFAASDRSFRSTARPAEAGREPDQNQGTSHGPEDRCCRGSGRARGRRNLRGPSKTGRFARLRPGRNGAARDRDVARLLREALSGVVLPPLRIITNAVRLLAACKLKDRALGG